MHHATLIATSYNVAMTTVRKNYQMRADCGGLQNLFNAAVLDIHYYYYY